MEHFWQNIEGWFDFQDIYSYVVKEANENESHHFVELGSWRGKSAAYMGVEIVNSKKDIKFDCVDIWDWSEEYKDFDGVQELYETFLSNMKPLEGKYNPVKSFTSDAAKLYEDNSLNFVFIDASHLYENVRQDILDWKPKLKPGGILAGHDFYCPDVNRAVKEILPENEIFVSINSWIYQVK